ncbi:Lsr2 family protein [Nocardia brasiliensis]|uniref:Lsr2 family protein n=1 Tax=Nocardia brasiliensis TaxID=37326 RepID=A0A6G9XX02_NOCBR|nr:Lsr2 family protein [Nocardia brasiliensis]
MARQIIEALIDDLDGSTADETVSFGFDGRMYEIDLSYANAAKLRALIDPWAEKARKTGRAGARAGAAPRTRTASGDGQLAAIRTWAAENGHRVSTRGRISAEVTAAYRAAHEAPQAPAVAEVVAEQAPASAKKPAVPTFVEPAKKTAKKSSKKVAAGV